MSVKRRAGSLGRPTSDWDRDAPSPEDVERFSDVTRPCPRCGAQLHDDVELCWKCGHALSSEPKGPPMHVVAVILVILLAIGIAIIF